MTAVGWRCNSCLIRPRVVVPWVTDWLGWKDSNLRITGSKPVALPLGYTPIVCHLDKRILQKILD